ncbi:NADH-quinone oxidoreductase subunit NuoN [Acetobacter oeni]|uniref:NADH-quinone oxidoreductase subunit N n=1 Tax=Acetobacter oeni TaxID=304077 RepID=A0A511XIU3_9PROT|nr:NADH-quinone oxidoreductase subunit NuoN [Acetobacter oeni]MBB3881967.1 NADH-quinone oxidoreductase subunit N [Acetobacter oeni]NHO17713.1 NADH-quinone oxidoreductase subunit NuoN [Acetobacter oeni]GBR07774.1 NADH-quinone oxidoreductase chain N [Acetobacter oeni LMG 21952]GEN62862.1 NADH-quinone oxidoreductase subunit N [Acetobacter oeni]
MNWLLGLPELVLAICALVILSAGVLQKKDEAFLPCAMLSIGAFVVTGFLVVGAPDGIAYNGLFVVDAFSRFIKLLAIIGGAAAIALSIGYSDGQRKLPFEMPVLVLFSTLGTMVMASSVNLMTLFVGLELSSLSIYILCAIERDRLGAAEAGLKYFILGSLASGLLLYGMSLVYGYAGTMEYAPIAAEINGTGIVPLGLVIGTVFIIVGLAFKLSAVPFHMWTPDVYQGAPTPVTAYMAGAPKFAAFALILRVMSGPFGAMSPRWQMLIEVIAALSMLFGSFAAIPQHNIKRLMAYSSIGHMGYAMMGLAAASPAGTTGTLVYLAAYLVMNAGTFGVIAAMRRRGHEVTEISDLAGLGRNNPGLALILAICMFSMIGAPPLAGFFGKFMVFAAAWHAGLYPLVAVGAVSAVVGAFYYLRLVKVAYFDAPAVPFDRPAPSVSFVSIAMGLATVLFLIGLGPISAAAQAAARALIG